MTKMRETALGMNTEDRRELEYVLAFRLEASSASYRIKFDPENIEDLFSLTAATENATSIPNRNMVIAIAETLEDCRRKRPILKEVFPGLPSPIPEGFESDSENRNLSIDLYAFYIGIMIGKWGSTPKYFNSFITFNYDMVLEEAFQIWRTPFRYEGLLGTGIETVFRTTSEFVREPD